MPIFGHFRHVWTVYTKYVNAAHSKKRGAGGGGGGGSNVTAVAKFKVRQTKNRFFHTPFDMGKRNFKLWYFGNEVLKQFDATWQVFILFSPSKCHPTLFPSSCLYINKKFFLLEESFVRKCTKKGFLCNFFR